MKAKNLILIVTLFLCCTACKKNQEGDWATYYKTVGEGYIYDATNNIPLKGASITVRSSFDNFMMYVPKTEETFYTDENGYYQIRFMKRAKDGKVLKYSFEVGSGPMIPPPPPYWFRMNPSGTFPDIGMYPEDIKDKKNITFDTIKFYRDNI